MADDKVQAVGAIYEAFGTGDVGSILDRLADDVDFGSEIAGRAPWHGRRTKAEVPAFFEAIGTNLDVTEFDVLTMTTNETDVQAVIRFGFTVRANGNAGAMDLHHWWRFRDGKVILYRGSEDTALTYALLGI